MQRRSDQFFLPARGLNPSSSRMWNFPSLMRWGVNIASLLCLLGLPGPAHAYAGADPAALPPPPPWAQLPPGAAPSPPLEVPNLPRDVPQPVGMSADSPSLAPLPQARRLDTLEQEESAGLRAYYLNDYATALNHWEQGLKQSLKQNRPETAGVFLLRLAHLHEHLRQYPSARQRLEQALDIHRDLGNRQAEAYDLTDLARIHEKIHQPGPALDYYRLALEIHRELGDQRAMGLDLDDLGRLRESRGELELALARYTEALNAYRAAGSREDVARILANLGRLREKQEDFRTSLENYQQALQIYRDLGMSQEQGFILTDSARLHRLLEQPGQAEAAYHQALAIYQELGDSQGEAFVAGLLADLYEENGRLETAVEIRAQALSAHRRGNDTRGAALELYALGDLRDRQGQPQVALSDFEQALNLYRQLGDPGGQSLVLSRLAGFYTRQGREAEALDAYHEVLAFYQQAEDHEGAMGIYNSLGKLALRMGRYGEARQAFEQALTLARDLEQPAARGNFLGNLGLVAMRQGDYPQAQDYFNQALALNREFGNRRDQAAALNSLGMVYLEMGYAARAGEHYRQALALLKDSDYPGDRANVLGNLGAFYSRRGDYDQALAAYREALDLLRKLEQRYDQCLALSNLAGVYANLGQMAAAREHFREALSLAENLDNPELRAAALAGLGNVLTLEPTDRDEAEQALRQALELTRTTGYYRLEGEIRLSLGNLYLVNDQPRKALAELQPALHLFRGLGNPFQIGLGLMASAGAGEKLGNIEVAEQNYRRALEIAEELRLPELEWAALSGLGKLLVGQDKPGEALQYYLRALETLENLRAGLGRAEQRLSFMRDRLFVYERTLELLYRLHQTSPEEDYPARALEVFERWQGRLLLEELGESGTRRFAGPPPEWLDRERELAETLADLRHKLALERGQPPARQSLSRLRDLSQALNALNKEQQDLNARLQREYPEYYALRHPRPVSPKQLQQQVLKQGEAMLLYAVLPEQTLVWWLTPERLSWHSLPLGEVALAQKVHEFRHALGVDPLDGRGLAWWKMETWQLFSERGQALYSELLPEIVRQALDKTEKIYLVPGGPLYRLPFEALPTAPALSSRQARYLLDGPAISYWSSASLLAALRAAEGRQMSGERRPLLAFADPVYSVSGRETSDSADLPSLRTRAYDELLPGGFAPLPETAREAQQIAALLSGEAGRADLYTGERASRSRVLALNEAGRLDDYRYLLFAAHGVLPGEVNRVNQPALVLSLPDPEGGEGFLTMSDVFGLRLNADLVSLSACNTGMGPLARGEGVIGLTRAFMYAGSPAVVVTLWSVNSAATRDLGVALFRALKTGDGPPAEALRQAKLALRQTHAYHHPYFWAAPVLFGGK